ncbi:helix-turn-helix transcriptional regulator [Aurantimonas litoralis]|nr:helix-turn-helix transcriptional regulator [Aurantimonas litoralis]
MHSADMEKSDRLRMAREAAGFTTGTDAASALGMKVATYLGHENGSRGYGAVAAATYGRRFKVDPSWLLFGTGKGPSGDASMTMGFTTHLESPPNAVIDPKPVTFDPNEKIPVYGHAVGGSEGQFPLNGNKIEDVLAPPALRGVRNAYGVMVAGDSMEPRYYAGETVYVNPGVSVRRGDFVVAQIRGDDPATPDAYVKRFVRKNVQSLTLSQFNPEQELTFDADRVVSVHRIVMGG